MKTTTRTDGRMSAVDAAIRYIERGWQPIPIPAGKKGPVLPQWQQLRITKDTAKRHFANDANVGLLLGTPSGGLLDVDVDHASALRLVGRLPKTDRIHGRSAKPASHFWYLCEGEIPAAQRFREPVTNETLIELRSTGGQTVVPPSVYRLEGTEDALRWEKDGEPTRIDGQELLQVVRRVAAIALLSKHWAAQPGSRHDMALALGGFLLGGGLAPEDAQDIVEGICECTGDEEAEDRIKAVADTAERLARGLPATGRGHLVKHIDPKVLDAVSEWLGLTPASEQHEWEAPVPLEDVRTPEIPADVLPGIYGKHANAVAEAAEVPPSMVVMTTLGALSAALTKKFSVVVAPDWIEPVNLYSVVAMPSGNNKSYVLRSITRPIDSWETDRRVSMEPAIRAATSQLRNEESAIASLRRRGASRADPAARQAFFKEVSDMESKLTKVPVVPQIYLNDATPESLAAAISDQGGQIAIISDEGGITETLAGLYSNGRANYDVLLKGYDGGQVRLKRKDREIHIRPHITLSLLVQPQVLCNMAEQKSFVGRGLYERILYTLPNSRLGSRSLKTVPVPLEVKREFDSSLRKLLDISIPTYGNGVEQPRPLVISTEAARLLHDFRLELEKELAPRGRLASIAGWAGKLAGTTARIAGLLHVAEHGESTTSISGSTMERALQIARLLIDHALAAFALMQQDEAMGDAKAIYDWALAHGEPMVGRTDILRQFHGRFTKVKRLDAALGLLRHHNVLGMERKLLNPSTGRKRRVYDINPMLFDHKG